MKRSMRRSLLAILFMLGSLPGGMALAEDPGLGVLSLPNTYACYFKTPFSDVFKAGINFSEVNGIGIDIWGQGDGYYLGFLGFFAGFYVAVDAIELVEEVDDDDDNLLDDPEEAAEDGAVITETTQKDLLMTLVGYTRGAYIFGFGWMALDYDYENPDWQFYRFYGILEGLGD